MGGTSWGAIDNCVHRGSSFGSAWPLAATSASRARFRSVWYTRTARRSKRRRGFGRCGSVFLAAAVSSGQRVSPRTPGGGGAPGRPHPVTALTLFDIAPPPAPSGAPFPVESVAGRRRPTCRPAAIPAEHRRSHIPSCRRGQRGRRRRITIWAGGSICAATIRRGGCLPRAGAPRAGQAAAGGVHIVRRQLQRRADRRAWRRCAADADQQLRRAEGGGGADPGRRDAAWLPGRRVPSACPPSSSAPAGRTRRRAASCPPSSASRCWACPPSCRCMKASPPGWPARSSAVGVAAACGCNGLGAAIGVGSQPDAAGHERDGGRDAGRSGPRPPRPRQTLVRRVDDPDHPPASSAPGRRAFIPTRAESLGFARARAAGRRHPRLHRRRSGGDAAGSRDIALAP